MAQKKFRLCWLLIGFLLASAGCQSSKPTIVLTSPPQGSTYAVGEPVAVQSAAADSGGIARVELRVDDAVIRTDAPPIAGGQPQFSVIQNWTAANPGSHTITVRAYNQAGSFAESGIFVTVNPAVAQANATPSPTPSMSIPSVTPSSAPTSAATATPTSLNTAPPTDTPTVAPTLQPTTPAPTPTAPLVELPPFDGGMDVSANYSQNGVFFRTEAHVIQVGGENGEGVDHVDMFIQDANGSVVDQRRENNAPYCYFGGDEGDCVSYQPDEHGNKWPGGAPIKPGIYFFRAVAYSKDNRIRADERSATITFPYDSFENLFAEVKETAPNSGSQEIENALAFQGGVSGVDVDDGTGEGIQQLDLYIVSYDGKIIYHRTEQQTPYCAFSDGGPNTPCNVYVFADHGGKWPNGAPVNKTFYILRVIARAKDGRVAAESSPILITNVQ